MKIEKKRLFILVGNDNTGKTTFQKKLIDKIASEVDYQKLPRNKFLKIVHSEIIECYKTVFFINRSIQEQFDEDIKSIDDYFKNKFQIADVCFLSSHLIKADIEELIIQSQKRFFNVTGVFFSNSIELNEKENSEISTLNWDDRIIIENPIIQNYNKDTLESQMETIAENFTKFLIKKLNNQ